MEWQDPHQSYPTQESSIEKDKNPETAYPSDLESRSTVSPNREVILWERILFHHFMDILVLGAVLFLIGLISVSNYEDYSARLRILNTHRDLYRVVRALELYTLDHPHHDKFPPGPFIDLPGYVLCPLQYPYPPLLNFLSTPVSYLERVPTDPYLMEMEKGDLALSPVILHWVRRVESWRNEDRGYEHYAWGALSVGPALEFPPQYSITALRKAPYDNLPLHHTLYHVSNGLLSMGLLYYDSMGNTSIQRPR